MGEAGTGGGLPREGGGAALFASSSGGGASTRGEKRGRGDADGFGKNTVLQPAGAERGAGKRGHASAVFISDEGAGAGPARGVARSGHASRGPVWRVHVRRRHARRRAEGHTRARAHRADESG